MAAAIFSCTVSASLFVASSFSCSASISAFISAVADSSIEAKSSTPAPALSPASSPGLSKSKLIVLVSASYLRQESNTFPAFEVKPGTFFLVFPVLRSSSIISSVSSTFAIVCHMSKPHSHSYFHWVFISFLPHLGQSIPDSTGFGFSGKSKVISPSAVSLSGASNFMPVFATKPEITSVFFLIRSSLS